MKKLVFLSVLSLFLYAFFFSNPKIVSAQGCIPDSQSCDQNNPCCNFPDVTCRGGYCQQGPACGRNNLPCCDPPNQQCETGLDCVGNYCVVPAQPSPSPPPQPSIPTQAPTPTGGGGSGGGGGGGSSITCNGGTGVETAIGCISFADPDSFMENVLSLAIGIGGGIAFVLMLFAGFQIMTSTGNPERLKAGQELLTSAIAGLILLVFSVFILRVIGVNILGIFQ